MVSPPISQINAPSISENPVGIDAVRETLHKLLFVRYVERCPSSEPVVSKPAKDEATTKKRGPKSAKVIVDLCQFHQVLDGIGLQFTSYNLDFLCMNGCSMDSLQINEVPETIEQRVLEAAVPAEGIRFSLTTNAGYNADRETISDDTPMMSVEENVGKTFVISSDQTNQYY